MRGQFIFCFTDQETQKEIVLEQVSSLMPLHLGHRTSLYFTDQETQDGNILRGTTNMWVRSDTHLFYKAQDPFSRLSKSPKTFPLESVLCGYTM